MMIAEFALAVRGSTHQVRIALPFAPIPASHCARMPFQSRRATRILQGRADRIIDVSRWLCSAFHAYNKSSWRKGDNPLDLGGLSPFLQLLYQKLATTYHPGETPRMSARPSTLQQLRDSGWVSKTVKQEIRDNFLRSSNAAKSCSPASSATTTPSSPRSTSP